MYAIIEVGAKQYNVKEGDTIEVEKLESPENKEIIIDQVLLVSKDDTIEIGTPYLKKAKVSATILEQTKGEKVISFKYRRRKSSHWKKGHRQQLTRIKIKEIKI